jgi:hypothetical protein
VLQVTLDPALSIPPFADTKNGIPTVWPAPLSYTPGLWQDRGRDPVVVRWPGGSSPDHSLFDVQAISVGPLVGRMTRRRFV